jgi:recombination protein RecA
MFGTGISREGDLLDMAAEMDIVQKSGSWFSYQGERLGQGRENVKEYFKSNPELFMRIEQQVRENVLQRNADHSNA